MMVMPSKRELAIREKVMPWLKFDADTEEFYLPEGAPDDVVDAWQEWKKIAKKRKVKIHFIKNADRTI